MYDVDGFKQPCIDIDSARLTAVAIAKESDKPVLIRRYGVLIAKCYPDSNIIWYRKVGV